MKSKKENNPLKILVTGAVGAIGTALVKKLVEEGYKVFGLDDYSVGIEANEVEGVQYIKIGTYDSNIYYLSLWKEIDVVFHLGEYSKIVPSYKEIDDVFKQNIIGSYNIIRLCEKHNIHLFYSASSTSLVNSKNIETSPYSLFKKHVVELIRNMAKWSDNFKYTICYFNNIYGPGTELWGAPYTSVVNIFKKQKEWGEPLTICGDGNQSRDFTHIDDLVRALWALFESPKNYSCINKEFEIGSGNLTTILDLAKAFDHPIKFIDKRKGEREGRIALTSELNKQFNWRQKHSSVIKFVKENY